MVVEVDGWMDGCVRDCVSVCVISHYFENPPKSSIVNTCQKRSRFM